MRHKEKERMRHKEKERKKERERKRKGRDKEKELDTCKAWEAQLVFNNLGLIPDTLWLFNSHTLWFLLLYDSYYLMIPTTF